jgi:hypothetical protein
MATDRAQYVTDLVVADGLWIDARAYGSTLDDVTLNAAIAAAGADTVTILMAPGAWSIDNNVTVLATTTLKFLRGAILTVDTGKTLTINSSIESGFFKIFDGVGDVIYGVASSLRVEWFGDYQTDAGDSLNRAVTALAAVGGEIVMPGEEMPLSTSVDVTNLNRNITFRGENWRNFDSPILYAATSGAPVFDISGTQGIKFQNMGIRGNIANPPSVGIFLARTTVRSSGTLHIQNCLFRGYYTNSALYNYGCEGNRITDSLFQNQTDATCAVNMTNINTDGLTSAFSTVLTGAQSFTGHYFRGCHFLANGTAVNTDCVKIEGASSMTITESYFWSGMGARAAIHIFGSTSSINLVINNCKFETNSGFSYCIHLRTVQPMYQWYIANCITDCQTQMMYAIDNSEIENSVISNMYDAKGAGISLSKIKTSTIIGNFVTTVRSIMNQCTTIGPPPVRSATDTNNVFIGNSDGSVRSIYGLFHYRGNTAAADFAVGDLTTDGTQNNIDLSSIIPVGTKAVMLAVHVKDDAAGSTIQFAYKNQANLVNVGAVATQVTNIDNYGDVIVCLQPGDRTVDYLATNVVWTTVNITVKGWWF